MALLGNVVVRRPGEPEVYAETADLHERFAPGNPDWGHPPLEDEVRATGEGWGLVDDPGGLFGPTTVRWYPSVQWFDGDGFAGLLRSTSLYRRLGRDVREPLLDAIAEHIRTRMGDQASRRYLSVLRAGQRADLPRRNREAKSSSRRPSCTRSNRGVVEGLPQETTPVRRPACGLPAESPAAGAGSSPGAAVNTTGG
jgi:hypothetical protein